MPIYEYDCPKCGRFEVLRGMSAPPLRKHDACGSRVRKVMSAGAFAFRGPGFHATDRRESHALTCEKPRGEGCAGCPAAEA